MYCNIEIYIGNKYRIINFMSLIIWEVYDMDYVLFAKVPQFPSHKNLLIFSTESVLKRHGQPLPLLTYSIQSTYIEEFFCLFEQ